MKVSRENISNDDKVFNVMLEMGIKDKEQAQDMVYMIDWATECNAELKSLFKEFQKDTDDNKTTYIEFCMSMWKDANCREKYLDEKKEKFLSSKIK